MAEGGVEGMDPILRDVGRQRHLKYSYEQVYRANMSAEGSCLTEPTMNVSLVPPADSPLPPDSFDTMCMLLKNDPVEEAKEDRDSGEPPVSEVARNIALAILSRISHLLGDNIDNCLRRLLPTEAALPMTSFPPTTHRPTTSPGAQASPGAVYDTLLLAWGQNSLTNLRNSYSPFICADSRVISSFANSPTFHRLGHMLHMGSGIQTPPVGWGL
nr:unnamed protein product [Spirometra erinaceieuropaei]